MFVNLRNAYTVINVTTSVAILVVVPKEPQYHLKTCLVTPHFVVLGIWPLSPLAFFKVAKALLL